MRITSRNWGDSVCSTRPAFPDDRSDTDERRADNGKTRDAHIVRRRPAFDEWKGEHQCRQQYDIEREQDRQQWESGAQNAPDFVGHRDTRSN